jgi:dipeptidase|tara:strand:- start:1549 stop:2664 length:1116 start_codon:yes stop_codon:yes gene_type:complete
MVANNPGQSPSVAIGTIPEVNSTYGYFEANYGIMNEWSVGFGESTCSGVFGTNSVGHGGKALLSIDSLSRIAMERAKTSKQAVHIMGTLAEKYGFYGAGSFEGSAESLMVVDPTEGWIFQILPDDTGASAIWAAARVPDDHVGIVANMFTIRGLDVDDTKNFAFSASVHTIAQKKGWWKPDDGPLDFTAIYSDGEYAHKFYSGRRMWGGYGMLAPSVKLPDNYTDLRFDTVYPTFVKPDKKVTVADLLAVHRTFYEGTKYDMTKGVAAGPFGNPDRFKTQGITKIKGAWERSIGLFRTTQAHVLQARSWLPKGQGGVVWYGPHAAHGSCFVPLTVGMTELPISHTTADPRTIDRTSAWYVEVELFFLLPMK